MSDTVDSVSTELAQGEAPQTTTMLDNQGNPIAYLYDPAGRRTVVEADQISDAMKLAIVSVEDRRFFDHQGVDWRGTFRAFLTNTSSGETQQGASTLTQQYVKNYMLLVVAQNDAERQEATEATSARKLKEIRIALALDKELGKEEILTRYLNLVPFGSGAYGIQSAAQTYFGVDAKDLKVPQAAMLAGMVQRSSVTPYTNPEAVLARRNVVLDTMQTNGVLNAQDTAAAKASPLGVLPKPNSTNNGCMGVGDSASNGFFCKYVVDYLADAGISPDQVNKGGYTIKTTLDPVVQASAKAAVNKFAPADLPKISSVMNIIQPGQTDHKVLAMASSRTYGLDSARKETSFPQTHTLESDGAGSIFKVFTTAAAMEQGMGINTVLDSPQTVRVSGVGVGGCEDGSKDYCVKNYNESYKLKYTVTDALAFSPNTAFVKLIAATGVAPTVDMAVKLGLRSYATTPASPATPNISIAEKLKAEGSASFTLGPVQVNPLEMANVAATIASGGVWCPPNPIDSITDSKGQPVKVSSPACEQVVEPGLAHALANAMSKDDTIGTAAGAAKTVGWDLPMSAKTGTTDREYSSAFLGFTNTLAGANLVFDDSGNPGGICHDPLRSCVKPDLTGGQEPARTWFAAMKPIALNYGPVVLPPVDEKYLNGSGKGAVPSVKGLTVGDASKRLTDLGFKVAQTDQPNGSTKGTVVDQSVTGTAQPGSTVTLSVSTGQAPSGRSTSPAPGSAPGSASSSPGGSSGSGGSAPQQTIQVPVPGVPPIVLPPGVVIPGIPPG
ncbi:transglycosylase domain-containing protein [Rhodococcus sp. X156]|uniref:penicillin-binding protein n=1 Tax=Rhodococcus sp. X156 TaxID=2499145 RepID=UPI000FDB96E4|nr:transglycosylase domain-containing protein [Rhodococcus sp. X156]